MTNEELYKLLRENYSKVNKDYLNEQMHKACKDMEISCFKCHGAGVYGVPLDDNGEWDGKLDLDVRRCEVCGGTGKITLARYEELQKGMRGDKE